MFTFRRRNFLAGLAPLPLLGRPEPATADDPGLPGEEAAEFELYWYHHGRDIERPKPGDRLWLLASRRGLTVCDERNPFDDDTPIEVHHRGLRLGYLHRCDLRSMILASGIGREFRIESWEYRDGRTVVRGVARPAR